MNINKYIASSGLTSRRKADELIKAGKVKINDKIAKPIDKVSENDIVAVEGKVIKQDEEKVYLIFNKPVGVITTTDENSPNNIIEAVRYPKRIFPVGRLDVNTSGLIILTNDGEIVNRILKGKAKIEKEYLIQVDKPIDGVFLKKLESGVMLEGHKTLPAKARAIDERRFSLTIVEGKKRQVRRMCEKFGYNVLKLQRIRIGKIELNDLQPGEYKELRREKIEDLLFS